jgi:hypothetical protein
VRDCGQAGKRKHADLRDWKPFEADYAGRRCKAATGGDQVASGALVLRSLIVVRDFAERSPIVGLQSERGDDPGHGWAVPFGHGGRGKCRGSRGFGARDPRCHGGSPSELGGAEASEVGASNAHRAKVVGQPLGKGSIRAWRHDGNAVNFDAAGDSRTGSQRARGSSANNREVS